MITQQTVDTLPRRVLLDAAIAAIKDLGLTPTDVYAYSYALDCVKLSTSSEEHQSAQDVINMLQEDSEICTDEGMAIQERAEQMIKEYGL